ncbi:hypothetical protein GGR56DRAFT_147726 [Xylariaceae sp. FL0804]|nr:hypothetical protein GGR56DRAFT_147726 [Xylariaceae sp. FL0804]
MKNVTYLRSCSMLLTLSLLRLTCVVALSGHYASHHPRQADGVARGNLVLTHGEFLGLVYVGDSESDAPGQFVNPPPTMDLQGRVTGPGLIDCHNDRSLVFEPQAERDCVGHYHSAETSVLQSRARPGRTFLITRPV